MYKETKYKIYASGKLILYLFLSGFVILQSRMLEMDEGKSEEKQGEKTKRTLQEKILKEGVK